MPSHWSSIGIAIDSEEEHVELAQRVAQLAEPVDVVGGCYLRWRDESGAEIWLQTNAEGELIGMNPHFDATSAIRVSLSHSVSRREDTELDGAFHCWAKPSDETDDPGMYPFVFDCPDFRVYRDLQYPRIARARIAAFAEELRIFSSEESYAASQIDEPRFASRSFIPLGLFPTPGNTEAQPAALAIMTGVIVEGESRCNGLTGLSFWRVKVDSLGGTFDAVIDPELVEGPLGPGFVVHGTFWLSGRLT